MSDVTQFVSVDRNTLAGKPHEWGPTQDGPTVSAYWC